MSKQTRNSKLQKPHKKLGKRGFGLAELVVAIALLAILAVAVYSFYEMMHLSAHENVAAYDTMEEYDKLKTAFCEWAAEKDTAETTFSITGGALTVERTDSEDENVRLSYGILLLGKDKEIRGFKNIKSIYFSANPDTDPGEANNQGALIKCVVTDETGKESHFVFSVRLGTVTVQP